MNCAIASRFRPCRAQGLWDMRIVEIRPRGRYYWAPARSTSGKTAFFPLSMTERVFYCFWVPRPKGNALHLSGPKETENMSFMEGGRNLGPRSWAAHARTRTRAGPKSPTGCRNWPRSTEAAVRFFRMQLNTGSRGWRARVSEGPRAGRQSALDRFEIGLCPGRAAGAVGRRLRGQALRATDYRSRAVRPTRRWRRAL